MSSDRQDVFHHDRGIMMGLHPACPAGRGHATGLFESSPIDTEGSPTIGTHHGPALVSAAPRRRLMPPVMSPDRVRSHRWEGLRTCLDGFRRPRSAGRQRTSPEAPVCTYFVRVHAPILAGSGPGGVHAREISHVPSLGALVASIGSRGIRGHEISPAGRSPWGNPTTRRRI